MYHYSVCRKATLYPPTLFVTVASLGDSRVSLILSVATSPSFRRCYSYSESNLNVSLSNTLLSEPAAARGSINFTAIAWASHQSGYALPPGRPGNGTPWQPAETPPKKRGPLSEQTRPPLFSGKAASAGEAGDGEIEKSGICSSPPFRPGTRPTEWCKSPPATLGEVRAANTV